MKDILHKNLEPVQMSLSFGNSDNSVLWFHYVCTICFTVEWFCQITIIFVACPESKWPTYVFSFIE